jgi:hypothetical protein
MRLGVFALASLAAAGLLVFAGCDSNPAQPTCTFTLSTTSMTMSAAGGAGSVTVTTGNTCAWTASSGASWITATGGTSGTGPGTFAFTAAGNSGTTPRTGSLTVAGQTVSVTQQGVTCAYALQPASRTVDAAGATATFDVNTDASCAWTAAATVAWLSVVSGGSGSGNGTVTYRAAANPDAASRTGSLTVGGGTHVVTQTGAAACTVDLSKPGDTFPVGGGTGTFDVSAASTCAWVAVSNVAWARVTDPSGGAGTGSRRVTYAVDANPEAGSRSGTISIGGRTFTITQAGATSCTYSVAPVDVRACMAEGFVRSVTVTTGAGCTWTSATGASWIAIASGLSGTGPGTINYTLGSNFDAARQANIEVRWPTPTAGQNVRVAQAGCLYGVSRDTIDVAAAGGDFSFDVVSQSTDTSCGGPLQNGCMWSAVSSASWVTVLSSMPRFGDDRVSIRVAANGTGSARTATITVRDRVVTIRQSP